MKIKSLFSPKKILMCLIFLSLVALVRFALRDMELDVDLLRESLMNAPGITIENIHMKREISGDLWQVQIPSLSREDERVIARSVDINRNINNNSGTWYFFCREIFYFFEKNIANAKGLLGTIESGSKIFNLESPLLVWQENTTNFNFPEGLIFYDNEFLLKTNFASMDVSGLIFFEKGVQIQWQKPLDM